MNQRNTLKRSEKLKSRKSIELLFRQGKSFSVFPFKVFYLVSAYHPAGPSTDLPAGSGYRPAGPSTDLPARSASRATGGPADLPAGAASRRAGNPAPLQTGFGVSARLFGKAVDRNRIKRLSREAWRLQRHPLSGVLREKGLSMTLFLIYTGKQLPDYQTVTQKIGVILQKLMKITA